MHWLKTLCANGMRKYSISLLNFLCAAVILLFAFFSIQYLTIGTAYIRADYSIFNRTLHTHQSMYQNYYYIYPKAIQKNTYPIISNSVDPQLAINLNTPLMNLFLKSFFKISNDLLITTTIWTLISFFTAGISTFLLIRYYKNDQNKWLYFLPSFALIWISWPSIYTQIGGQVSYLILPLLLLSFFFGYLNRQIPMTIMLALIASMKIFFLLFLLLFWLRREWRLSLLFIFCFLLFFFLPLIVFSWQDYIGFFHLTRDYNVFIRHSAFASNGALLSFFLMLISYLKLNITIFQLQILITVVSAYILFRWIVYYRHYVAALPNYSYEIGFSFTIILALLLSPLAWVYYYLFLCIPVVTLLKINTKYRFSTIFYVFFALALYFPLLAWLSSPLVYLQMIRHFASFVDLLLWLICMHIAVRTVTADKIITTATRKTPFYLLILNIALTISMLLFNYGFPFYFTFNKEAYKKVFTPGVWVNVEKRLNTETPDQVN